MLRIDVRVIPETPIQKYSGEASSEFLHDQTLFC